jgi:hypothetical protein
MNWWATTPVASLSQGDVIGNVPVAVVVHPLAPLEKKDLVGQRGAWVPLQAWTPDKDEMGHVLGKGRLIPVIVLTESCQIDKNESKGRVIVAPIYSAQRLRDDNERALVWGQQRRSKMPLDAVPTIGASYADLRMTTAIDQRFLDVNNRIAQLSEDGVRRLQMQLLAFFTGLRTETLFSAALGADAVGQGDDT